MVRCTRCRFSFEAEVPGLLPACRQCGADTVRVARRRRPTLDDREPTLEFAPSAQTA